MTERRAQLIAGLRELADLLESNPNVPAPKYVIANVFAEDRSAVIDAARATAWEKVYLDKWFTLRRTFGEDLALEVTIEREQVCRRVVTGTRIVPAKPEHEVEEVTWVCDDPLLSVA